MSKQLLLSGISDSVHCVPRWKGLLRAIGVASVLCEWHIQFDARDGLSALSCWVRVQSSRSSTCPVRGRLVQRRWTGKLYEMHGR
jgi:hypothetical protein